MIPAATIAKLATLGLTPSQAEAVAAMLTEVEQATEAKAGEAIEARRKADRDRQTRRRSHVMSRDITGQHVTGCDEPPKVSPPRDINQPPLPNPPSSLRSVNSAREAFCETAWRVIPKRRGDSFKPFRKALLKALADGADEMEITNGIAAYARSERDADPQFRKGAAVWVNNHCWTADWSKPDRPPPRPGTGGGFASLMAKSIAERHDEQPERIDFQNVPVLSIGNQDGRTTGGNDDGGISGNRVQLLVAGSVRRM